MGWFETVQADAVFETSRCLTNAVVTSQQQIGAGTWPAFISALYFSWMTGVESTQGPPNRPRLHEYLTCEARGERRSKVVVRQHGFLQVRCSVREGLSSNLTSPQHTNPQVIGSKFAS